MVLVGIGKWATLLLWHTPISRSFFYHLGEDTSEVFDVWEICSIQDQWFLNASPAEANSARKEGTSADAWSIASEHGWLSTKYSCTLPAITRGVSRPFFLPSASSSAFWRNLREVFRLPALQICIGLKITSNAPKQQRKSSSLHLLLPRAHSCAAVRTKAPTRYGRKKGDLRGAVALRGSAGA